jgi:hypothetical protein
MILGIFAKGIRQHYSATECSWSRKRSDFVISNTVQHIRRRRT